MYSKLHTSSIRPAPQKGVFFYWATLQQFQLSALACTRNCVCSPPFPRMRSDCGGARVLVYHTRFVYTAAETKEEGGRAVRGGSGQTIKRYSLCGKPDAPAETRPACASHCFNERGCPCFSAGIFAVVFSFKMQMSSDQWRLKFPSIHAG